MKTIVLILFILLPVRAMSQIGTQVSFDEKNKILSLVLTNETGNVFTLTPPPMHGLEVNYKTLSYVVIQYKNKNNIILCTQELAINEYQPNYRLKSLLLPNQESDYKYNLLNWCKEKPYSVDIYI